MTITTLTSREFDQAIGRAKRAAHSGLVFITNRSRPTHVLLSVEDYRRLAGERRSLVEALSMEGLSDIDFEPAKLRIETSRADLS